MKVGLHMALEPATYGEDLEDEFERAALAPIKVPRRACGKWAWLSKKHGYMPFRCGSSTCSKECAKIFHWRRIKLVDALVKEHGLIRFFTLTIARECDKVKAWDEIHHAWSVFRQRMKRRFNPFLYVAILEGHKDAIRTSTGLRMSSCGKRNGQRSGQNVAVGRWYGLRKSRLRA